MDSFGLTLSLVNHDVQLTVKFDESVESSGLIYIPASICVMTWR